MHRGRSWIVVFGLALAMAGCSEALSGIQPKLSPELRFAGWVRISADSCWGSIRDLAEGAFGSPTNLVMRFWYATATGETLRVVHTGESFPVPVQRTRGEPRYPRVGEMTWDGGVSVAEPRAPSIFLGGSSPYWTALGPDSMTAVVANGGGYAYHLTMEVENRNGIQQLTVVPDPLPSGQSTIVVSVPRFFTTNPIAPQIRRIRWEDYGGVRDSMVPPP